MGVEGQVGCLEKGSHVFLSSTSLSNQISIHYVPLRLLYKTQNGIEA